MSGTNERTGMIATPIYWWNIASCANMRQCEKGTITMHHQQSDFARAFILLFSVPLILDDVERQQNWCILKERKMFAAHCLPTQSLRHCLLISLERTETEKCLFVFLR
jgi:hypothetical protein